MHIIQGELKTYIRRGMVFSKDLVLVSPNVARSTTKQSVVTPPRLPP